MTEHQTVFAQAGTYRGGIYLKYDPDLARWSFGRPSHDAVSPSFQSVESQGPASSGWTRLVGVYDMQAAELRLYVDGVVRVS